jgi:hypothetical protein
MTARLTFLGIAIFWLTMNGLLWRAEFGPLGGDTEVPVLLVWHKILTTPDSSSLTVFQNHERIGYCEFATSVGREMAAVDDEKLPPDGLVRRAGYQIHMAGNILLGELSNRLRFDGNIQFTGLRQWQEIQMKFTLPGTVLHIRSLATNQTLRIQMETLDGVVEREINFAELQKPDALLTVLLGGFATTLLETMELTDLENLPSVASPAWKAVRTRTKIGTETLPIYRLQTSLLGRNVTVDVSTLGELLRVELPGDFVAQIEEWRRP